MTKLHLGRTSAVEQALVGAKGRVALVNQARRSGLTLQIGIALVGATLIVGLWAAVWAVIWRDREQAVSDAKSDGEHFQVHIAEHSGRLIVGKPWVGRVSNKWSIQHQTPTWSGRW